jgi:glutaredoxin
MGSNPFLGDSMIQTDEDDEFDRIERENAIKGQPYYWKPMEVVIYTKRLCPNCTEVKQLLRAKNINYVEMDMESSPDLPHIFINGKRVDGLAALQEAIKGAKQPC